MSLTRPFTFHVPVKIMHRLVVEYSGNLCESSAAEMALLGSKYPPSFQGLTNEVVDRVENGDLPLCAHVALHSPLVRTARTLGLRDAPKTYRLPSVFLCLGSY